MNAFRIWIENEQSIAKTFAMASAKAVIVCGRRTIPLEESKTEIQTVAPGCDVDVVSLDVTDEKNVQDVFAKFKKRNILIDVLVNNAGSGRSDTPVRDSDLNVWWGDFVSRDVELSKETPIHARSRNSMSKGSFSCLENIFSLLMEIPVESSILPLPFRIYYSLDSVGTLPPRLG